ncbi:GAF domain-containing protein [uncultured Chloroflexus sp.]|uniref:sensor histidine kinase n=1 Tax=uncultured Chloroflexus sp. TaxID=214040 RepID=UPI00261697F4|nr:GAF domain-containing protein [uncultured Chloroflexus sp.]
MINQEDSLIEQPAQIDIATWLHLVTAITNAQQLDELERVALAVCKIALPRHRVSVMWIGQGEPACNPEVAVRVLGNTEQYGWLIHQPAELTATETAVVQAVERLISVGYERVLQHSKRQHWRQRLRFEVEVLRDCDDPDLICRQLSQVIGELMGSPVDLGVVVPFKRSTWLELIAQYRAQPMSDKQRFWSVDTDLSSVVIKRGVPISSVAYLTDCIHYNVRPHPDHNTAETAPTYWVGSPIRFAGETLGAVYLCSNAIEAISEAQRQLADEAAYYAGYLLRPILLRRAVQEEQERREAWADIVAASVHVVDLDRTLQAILDTSCRLLDVLGGGLFLFDEQQQVLVFQYASGPQPHKLLGFRLPLTHGLIGQSFASGQPIIVNDAVQDPRRSYTLDQTIGVSCYNLIVVPFTTPAGVRAALQYINRRRGAPFNEEDIEQIRAVTALIGLVLDRSQQLAQVETSIIQHVRDLDRRNADLLSVLALNRELLSASSQEQLFQLIVDTISQRMQFLGAALFVNRREHSSHAMLECVATTGALANEFSIGSYLSASRLDVLANEWSFGEHCFLLNRRSQTFARLFDLPLPSGEQWLDFGATRWTADDLLVTFLRAANREVRAVLLLDQPVSGQRPEIADLQVLSIYASIAGAAIDMALLRDRQQQSLARLTALNGLGMVIHSQSLPQPQILEMTARGMIEIVGAKWAQIVLFDADRDELRIERTIGICLLNRDVVITLARRAIINRQPVFRSATTIAVPLRGTQRMIGVIVVGGDHSLDSTDVEILLLYASQTAVAIESMRLLEEVRRGRDNLARAMAAVEDGLLLFAADGSVIIANEAFCRLAHTTAWEPPLQHISGTLLDELLMQWAAQRSIDQAAIMRLQRSLTMANAQGELASSDGIFAWTLTQAGDLSSDHTQMFLLTIRDITAAKKAELLRADLTHMVIHDLRQPLSSIMLAFEQLMSELGELLTERQQQAVRIGQNSARQLLNLVNTMLDIGRLESGQMPLDRGPVPVETLIERVIDPFAIQAQLKGVQVLHRVDPQMPMLYADSVIVARVLQNLLDNALKFSPPRTTITIEVEVAPAHGSDQKIIVSDELIVTIPGDRVAHIVVRDQGQGIPSEDQIHIFDRFRQAGRQRSEGSGLGLAFCRLAVLAHQGTIWVESELDRGSAFHVTLPLAEISGE